MLAIQISISSEEKKNNKQESRIKFMLNKYISETKKNKRDKTILIKYLHIFEAINYLRVESCDNKNLARKKTFKRHKGEFRAFE